MTARIAAGLALLAALCSCGQVGPLYLPDDQNATNTEVSTPPPATSATGDTATPAPGTPTAPATDTTGGGGGTDTTGTDAAGAAVPDRTNEPRRRAH